MVKSPGWIQVINLYLKVSHNFLHLILLDVFWIVYISFGYLAKFYFLAQFPVDHFPHSVMSG